MHDVAPHDIWRIWTVEPLVGVALIGSATLYVRGTATLWRRAGAGRAVRPWQAWCFAGGWLALVVALVSPLDALGGALFSAHMVQHEMLMAVAAPLLVLSRPQMASSWALPPRWRVFAGRIVRQGTIRRWWLTLTAPAVATMLHAATLWIWHAPALYAATLRSELVHALQHTSFLAAALLFWWSMIGPAARRSPPLLSMLCLFATTMLTGALGALATFAVHPWYAPYTTTSAAWGVSALEDQQLAGLVMWVPGSLPYILAALAVLGGWLRRNTDTPCGGGAAGVSVIPRSRGARVTACDPSS